MATKELFKAAYSELREQVNGSISRHNEHGRLNRTFPGWKEGQLEKLDKAAIYALVHK